MAFLLTMVFFVILCSWLPASGILTPEGVNFEVQALIAIKASLKDPHGVLNNWDPNSVDPCSWSMVTCSPENLVIGLEIPSQNLSGPLSATIGNLTNLEIVLLQDNNITGPIPHEIGKLAKLKTLDLANNHFSGEIPSTVDNLESLQYLRLNNNNLSGAFPSSSSSTNLTQLVFLDLSYNNLSGPIPAGIARTFNIVGNPLICATGVEQDCLGTVPMPMSYNLNNSQDEMGTRIDELEQSIDDLKAELGSENLTPTKPKDEPNERLTPIQSKDEPKSDDI